MGNTGYAYGKSMIRIRDIIIRLPVHWQIVLMSTLLTVNFLSFCGACSGDFELLCMASAFRLRVLDCKHLFFFEFISLF